MEPIAFSGSEIPREILTNGRKRAPEYPQIPERPEVKDKDGKVTQARVAAHENPAYRADWLRAVGGATHQEIVDTLRGMYHEGVAAFGEIDKLRGEIDLQKNTIKSFRSITSEVDAHNNAVDTARKRYRVAFWMTLVGAVIAIPTTVAVEIHKKDKAIQEMTPLPT